MTANGSAPSPRAAKSEAGTKLVRPIGPDASIDPREVKLFPVAEARVVTVTTLRPDGAGSLRAALREKGPSLIVF